MHIKVTFGELKIFCTFEYKKILQFLISANSVEFSLKQFLNTYLQTQNVCDFHCIFMSKNVCLVLF